MNQKTKEPATIIAEYIVKRFKDEKILMSTEGKYGNVLKFKPPMVFSMKNAEQWIKTFENVLQEIYADEYSLISISRSSCSSMESLESVSDYLNTIDSDQSDEFSSS